MLTIGEIANIIKAHQHDVNVAAMKLSEAMCTRNPVSGCWQSPHQVHWERDSLYLSQNALKAQVTRLKLQVKRRNARIKMLRAKLKAADIISMLMI